MFSYRFENSDEMMDMVLDKYLSRSGYNLELVCTNSKEGHLQDEVQDCKNDTRSLTTGTDLRDIGLLF